MVVAADQHPLLELRAGPHCSLLFLQEKLKVGSALVLNLEWFDGMVTFVAHKDINLQAILRAVEVVDGNNLATDLHLLVFEKDVLGLETLLFIFLALLLMGQEFLKFGVHYYYKLKFKPVLLDIQSLKVFLEVC